MKFLSALTHSSALPALSHLSHLASPTLAPPPRLDVPWALCVLAQPWSVVPLSQPRTSMPISPPRPIDWLAPAWLLALSAPLGTIVPTTSLRFLVTGTHLVSCHSTCAMDFWDCSCALFLHPFCQTGSSFPLGPPWSSVAPPSSQSSFINSTKVTCCCGAALVSRNFYVAQSVCHLHLGLLNQQLLLSQSSPWFQLPSLHIGSYLPQLCH